MLCDRDKKEELKQCFVIFNKECKQSLHVLVGCIVLSFPRGHDEFSLFWDILMMPMTIGDVFDFIGLANLKNET